jgi:hypothetical protein
LLQGQTDRTLRASGRLKLLPRLLLLQLPGWQGSLRRLLPLLLFRVMKRLLLWLCLVLRVVLLLLVLLLLLCRRMRLLLALTSNYLRLCPRWQPRHLSHHTLLLTANSSRCWRPTAAEDQPSQSQCIVIY